MHAVCEKCNGTGKICVFVNEYVCETCNGIGAVYNSKPELRYKFDFTITYTEQNSRFLIYPIPLRPIDSLCLRNDLNKFFDHEVICKFIVIDFYSGNWRDYGQSGYNIFQIFSNDITAIEKFYSYISKTYDLEYVTIEII